MATENYFTAIFQAIIELLTQHAELFARLGMNLFRGIDVGCVGTGVIVPVGPIFGPFFIVPPMEWLFWGWLRAFLHYAFYQVVANAFVFVFGNLILHFFDKYPPPYSFEQLAALFMPM